VRGLLGKNLRVGLATEPVAASMSTDEPAPESVVRVPRSLQKRHVDAATDVSEELMVDVGRVATEQLIEALNETNDLLAGPRASA